MLVDLRTHLDRLIESIAYFESAGAFGQSLGKLACDGFVDNDAAGGGAALPGRAEGSPECAVEGEIKVGIGQHDHCIFAPHLKRAGLEAGCSILAH